MKEMHCTQDTLHLLLDGELSAQDERAARAHLASCDACASRYLSLQRFDVAVRNLPHMSVPPGFTAAIMSALDPVMPASRAFRFLTWMAIQVGFVAVLLLGLGVCAAAGLISPGEDAPGSLGAGALSLLERALAFCGPIVASLRGDALHAGPLLITFSAALVVLLLALVDRMLSTRESTL